MSCLSNVFFQREDKKKDKELAKRAIKKEKKAIKTLLKPVLECDGPMQLAAIQKLEIAFEALSTLDDYETYHKTFAGVKTDAASLMAKLNE
jgi:hypothetical protein